MKTTLRLTIAALGVALLHASAAVAQNEFSYMIPNGTVIITGYNGPGGEVTVPSTINDLPVVGIRNEAFAYNMRITGLTIPEGVKDVGNKAFFHCVGLASVAIPGSAGSLGGWLFCSCRSLTNATIGEGVTSIGFWEFYWCTSLPEVTIPDSVDSIEYGAFYHCSSLTSVTVGKNVSSIGMLAFADCTNLTGIYFTGNAPTADETVFSGADQATVYYLPGTTGWGATFAGRPTAPWGLPATPLMVNRSSGPAAQTDGSGFTIYWAANKTVVVEACTNLRNPTWVPVSTNTLVGGSAYFSDPQRTNYPSRFYRVRAL